MHPRTAGKFIDITGERYLIKGACYGTFAPSDGNGHFPRLEQVRADFALMARSGFNTVRTYTVPSIALLDEAAQCGLRVMIIDGGAGFTEIRCCGHSLTASSMRDLQYGKLRRPEPDVTGPAGTA